jgi:spermidine/putrescine transport system permease protein
MTRDGEWLHRAFLSGFYWLFVAYLSLPLALMALVSFKITPIVGFPIGALTTRWYGEALGDDEMLRAFGYSALVAAASTILAATTGVWIALAIAGVRKNWLRGALLSGAMIPLITPGVIHAIALRMSIHSVDLDPGPLAVVLGHAIHAAPYVVIMVTIRLRMMPPALIEAARDLGASAADAFVRVTFPWLRPAILGACVLAALTSFDDFLRSFFLSGYDATLPVLIYGRIRSGLTPEINAVATLVLLVTITCGLAGERLAQRAGAR